MKSFRRPFLLLDRYSVTIVQCSLEEKLVPIPFSLVSSSLSTRLLFSSSAKSLCQPVNVPIMIAANLLFMSVSVFLLAFLSVWNKLKVRTWIWVCARLLLFLLLGFVVVLESNQESTLSGSISHRFPCQRRAALIDVICDKPADEHPVLIIKI